MPYKCPKLHVNMHSDLKVTHDWIRDEARLKKITLYICAQYTYYKITTLPIRCFERYTDRKRHAALPHGGHIVVHRLGNNVHVAVFRSVLQRDQTDGIIREYKTRSLGMNIKYHILLHSHGEPLFLRDPAGLLDNTRLHYTLVALTTKITGLRVLTLDDCVATK